MSALDFILSKKVFPIHEIKGWVKEHSGLFKKISKDCNCAAGFNGLPCICERIPPDAMFYKMYQSFEELLTLHKLEEFAREQLEDYRDAQGDLAKVKQWLIKNEDIACKELACLLVEHLEYAENIADNYDLLAFSDSHEEVAIFARRADFENLVRYKELFDDLYYVQKLYPEGLERIEEEMRAVNFEE